MRAPVLFVLRILTAGLFCYAGFLKLMEPDVFLSDLESYRMLPYSIAWVIAFYLPPFEIICGLALFFPAYVKPSALLLLILTFVFILVLGIAWMRGLDISCGCFGDRSGKVNYPWLIFRDIFIFIVLCLFICFNKPKIYEDV